MRHTRSQIKSYDRQIAKAKAGNIVDDPLNMRPARAWDSRTGDWKSQLMRHKAYFKS